MRSILLALVAMLFVRAGICDQPTSDLKAYAKAVEYYRHQDAAVSGYLAIPDGSGPFAAVILIHEWWGLNDDIRGRARQFSEQGYAALAIDLYNGRNTEDPKRAGQLAAGVRDNMPAAFDNLNAALAFLSSVQRVDNNRIASVGWCFGGGWSYQMAKNDLGVKASVIYYGRFNPADDLQQMRAEILGHFAEQDRIISLDDVHALQAKLQTLNGKHEIYIYPNTTHGFASRQGSNPGYVDGAADLAWQRTLGFLRMHL